MDPHCPSQDNLSIFLEYLRGKSTISGAKLWIVPHFNSHISQTLVQSPHQKTMYTPLFLLSTLW